MGTVLLAPALFFAGLKATALLVGGVRTGSEGRKLIELVRAGAPSAEMSAEIGRLNVVDGLISRIRPRPLCALVEFGFRGPVVITCGSVLLLLRDTAISNPTWLAPAVGVAVAACAVLHLAIALLRPLVIGREAWRTPDISLPKPAFAETWAVHTEPGSNVAVYFLALIYVAVLGFAGLYSAIYAAHPTAFHVSPAQSGFTWLYFSATTISTIGFGDVYPHAPGAQIAVLCQIAAGPLLLSWLVAILLTPNDEAVRRAAQDASDLQPVAPGDQGRAASRRPSHRPS